MKIITSSFAPVIHTPFVIGKGDSPQIVCSGGENSRAMDIWLISTDEAPLKLIDATNAEMSSACGPWVVAEPDDSVSLYCSTMYHKNNLTFRISKYVADDLRGPYTLAVEDVLGTYLNAHSPCIVDDYMYFVHGYRTIARRLVAGGPIEDLMAFEWQQASELFKPNIYRTAPDQLCMFLTEVINVVDYTVGIYTSPDGVVWERVGQLTAGMGAYSYKPALYKGNLIRVGRETPRFSEQENTWFEFEHIKLSEISPVFTDYPYDYYFPDFIL